MGISEGRLRHLWYTESDTAGDLESVGVNSPCGFEPGDQSGRTVQVRASPTMIIPGSAIFVCRHLRNFTIDKQKEKC